MKPQGAKDSFTLLAVVAALDLLAGIFTDAPDALIIGVLGACFVLMLLNEFLLARQPPADPDVSRPFPGETPHLEGDSRG